MEGLTGRLTGCEQQGLMGQVSDVTSDVDKMDFNNRSYSRVFSSVGFRGILPLLDPSPVLLNELGCRPSALSICYFSY